MTKYLLFSLLIATTLACARQGTLPLRFSTSINATPDRYEGMDTFGWHYTIYNNCLTKQKGELSVQYKNVSLGKISKADIQNPLQVVLYYRDFNTAVLLDNQLNEVTRINFSMLPTPLVVDAVGLASQNRLWIFDNTEQRLGLYTLDKPQYTPLTAPFAGPIIYYHSDYNYFYWIDDKHQCFAASVFGKVNFLGNVPDFDQVQFISDKYLIYRTGDQLLLYNMQNETAVRIETTENSFRSFHYASQILSIFTNAEINQYQITIPE